MKTVSLFPVIVVALVSTLAIACGSEEPTSSRDGSEEINERTGDQNDNTREAERGDRKDDEDVDETGKGRRGRCWELTQDVRCWQY